jgi:hypothetical protein
LKIFVGKVYYKNAWYETFEDVPEDIRSKGFILETMFPDYRSNRSDLENCIRFFPHLFNTGTNYSNCKKLYQIFEGGFFVAVFHKLYKLRWKQKEIKVRFSSGVNDFKHIETNEQCLEEKEKEEEKEKIKLLSRVDSNNTQEERKVLISSTLTSTLNSESNIDLISREKFHTQADFLSFDQYFTNDDNFEKRNEFWKSLGVRYGFSSPPKDVWRRLLVRTVSQESPRKVFLQLQFFW